MTPKSKPEELRILAKQKYNSASSAIYGSPWYQATESLGSAASTLSGEAVKTASSVSVEAVKASGKAHASAESLSKEAVKSASIASKSAASASKVAAKSASSLSVKGHAAASTGAFPSPTGLSPSCR